MASPLKKILFADIQGYVQAGPLLAGARVFPEHRKSPPARRGLAERGVLPERSRSGTTTRTARPCPSRRRSRPSARSPPRTGSRSRSAKGTVARTAASSCRPTSRSITWSSCGTAAKTPTRTLPPSASRAHSKKTRANTLKEHAAFCEAYTKRANDIEENIFKNLAFKPTRFKIFSYKQGERVGHEMKWEFDEVGVRRSSPACFSRSLTAKEGLRFSLVNRTMRRWLGGVRQEPGPGIAALRVPGGAAGRVARGGARRRNATPTLYKKLRRRGLGANVADFPDGHFRFFCSTCGNAAVRCSCGSCMRSPSFSDKSKRLVWQSLQARAARAARAAGGGLRKRTYKGRPQSNQQHRKSTEQYVKHC